VIAYSASPPATTLGQITIDATGTGSMTVSQTAGTLSSTNEIIGFLGTGTFTQSGGTHTVSGAITLAAQPGSQGTYNLGGGSLSAGAIYLGGSSVGSGGTGVVSMSAGVVTTTLITIYNTSGTSLTLSGGTINTSAVNVNGVPASFVWTGGTLKLTTNVIWDSAADGTTTGAMFGSSLALGTNQTLMVSGDEQLGGSGEFSLTLNGGSTHYVTGGITLSPLGTITQNAGSTLYAATFTQAGGTVNGTLQNQGTFIYQSGLFNGRLLNQGTVVLNADFTAGNGVENDTSIVLSAGRTLTVNGAGLDNLGMFNLAGGTISGAGPITNDYSGSLIGAGTINPTVTTNGLAEVVGVLHVNGGIANAGIIGGGGTILGAVANNLGGILTANNPSAPLALDSFQGNAAGANVEVADGCLLSITNAWTNSGMVVLQGNNAVLNGAAITNNGTIQGIGNLNSPVVNTGTIEALGGTLTLGGSLTNPTGGLLTSGTGSKLFIASGLATNAGIVNLTGGTFDNNGHPLHNMGEISGWGIFRTGGTGLDNNGSITFSGGQTTVNGPVTNEGGKTITVTQNNAIFTGLVTNNANATFNAVNATATFAGGFVNNGNRNFVKAGGGTVEIDSAPTLKDGSTLSVMTGTMRFNVVSGAPTIGTGVTAVVSTGAMLELAGSVSALANGPNRVNITNNSSAPGILVTGTRQQVGNIDGSGTTQVNAGSDLAANHIIQSALVIGGTAKNPGLVTIDASDTSGNPLASLAGAASLIPGTPFGADGIVGSSFNGDLAASSQTSLVSSIASNSTAVPEPSSLLLLAIGSLALGRSAIQPRSRT
jgi:hypothetical protein